MGVNETSGFLRPMTPHLDAEYWTRSIGASAWETWVTPRIWQTCQSTTSKSTTNPRPPPPPPRLVPEFCFQTAYDALSVRGTSKKCTKLWWHTCAHVTYSDAKTSWNSRRRHGDPSPSPFFFLQYSGLVLWNTPFVNTIFNAKTENLHLLKKN